MKKIAIAIGIIGIAVVIGVLLFTASAPGDTVASELEGTKSPATYIGVGQCKTCHPDKYDEWNETGHGSDFTKKDYHGSEINLYIRNSPDPANYTPGSCAVCHTVGYNEESLGGFNSSQAYNSSHNIKFLGIQCENCHGPGSDHPGSSDKAGTINGNPTIAESCYGDTNSGCHGPSGHDNYYRDSKHNNSLDANSGGVATTESCQKCHTREGFMNFLEGTTTAITDPNPVDCATCHDPHEDANEFQLRLPPEEICAACHNNGYSTEPGHAVHHPQAEMNQGISGALAVEGSGMPGVDCVDCHMWTTPSVSRAPITDTIGGEEHHDHEFEPTAGACADCHSTIITAYLPTAKKPTSEPDPSDTTNYTIWQDWVLFETLWENEEEKWQKVIDSWQEDVEERWTEVDAMVTAGYDDLVAANATGTKDQASIDKAFELYEEAAWNLDMVEADGSMGVHNFEYAMALLDEAEKNMDMVAELITVEAVEPPEPATDYTLFFVIVIVLLVISMLLSIMALMRKPQAMPPEPSKPPEEPPKAPEEPKEV